MGTWTPLKFFAWETLICTYAYIVAHPASYLPWNLGLWDCFHEVESLCKWIGDRSKWGQSLEASSPLNFHFQRTILSLRANMSTATQVLVLALFKISYQNVKTSNFESPFCIVIVDCLCPFPCLSLRPVFFLSEQVTKYLRKIQNLNLA